MSEPGAGPAGLDQVLADRIGRFGSIRFDEFVHLALNDPEHGFFASGGGAGRREGDFITSPEVGPLFGAVVARFLDRRWDELGRPDPFVVVDAGAGRGALALAVLAAAPACGAALRYVLVESSPALRAQQAHHLPLAHPFEVLGPEADPESGSPSPGRGDGPLSCALEDLPAQPFSGVILANELLDNLPFRVLERTDVGWAEVRVGLSSGRLVELLVPADGAIADRADALAPDAEPARRIPLQEAAGDWLRRAHGVLRQGSVLVIDYAVSTTAALGRMDPDQWLRTYRSHGRGDGALQGPGTQDVTCEVAVDQLTRVASPAIDMTQEQWLRRWGVEELVEEGRQMWEDRAGVGDLAALRARSRSVEAEALTDPTGLGGFRVLEWRSE